MYDNLNRLTTKTYPDGTQATYAYDALGRLVSAANANSTISYSYDALGRVIQATQDGNAVGYEYDGIGNRTRLVYPDGNNISYSYDVLNRLDQIQDGTGQVVVDYTYDNVSRRTQVDLPNGTQATYQYDQLSRLTDLTNKVSATDAIISSFAYTYDKVGNRTSMTTTEGSHSYTYDKIYQLTRVDYPDGYLFPDMTYTFDPVGNRISAVNGGTTTYATNTMNQYTDVGGMPYTYDASGNLTSDGTNTYAYDFENRLIQVVTPSETATFAYDSLGRRVSKTNFTETTRYLYDGDQVIAEEDGSETLLRRFVYGPGIDEPVVMADAGFGETYTYHFDGLGSVTEMTDTTGGVVETYQYDVYGEPIIRNAASQILTDSAIGNPYLFTGRQYDPETGLFYYRARYYAPKLGRFLQTDPLTWVPNDPRLIDFHRFNSKVFKVSLSSLVSEVQKDGILGLFDDYSQSIENAGVAAPILLNRYSYVRNNPVLLVDPQGLWVTTAIGIVNGGISGFIAGIRSGNITSGIIGGVVGAAVGGAVGTFLPGAGGIAATLIVNSILSGTIGGAVGGAVGAFISNGNIAGPALSGAVCGAVTGLASGIGASAARVAIGAMFTTHTGKAAVALLSGSAGRTTALVYDTVRYSTRPRTKK